MDGAKVKIISLGIVGVGCTFVCLGGIAQHYADEPSRAVAECSASCDALGAEYVLANRYGCICSMGDELTTEQEDLISRRFVLTEQLGD
jgi:hypothetical protein